VTSFAIAQDATAAEQTTADLVTGLGALWAMIADGSGKHLVPDVGGVGSVGAGSLLDIRLSGWLLGGMEANFPGSKPQP
jgi:hypothetical protein